MPSKKKKKKKKQPKPIEIEFDLNFTDVTMIEADGEFDMVKRLVEEDIGPHNWNVNTFLTIDSPFGTGRLELDLKSDRSIYILNYACTGNPATTPDLSALVQWSQNAGWKFPQPSIALVKSNVAFWRYMWETLIVDSDYMDERFGVRKSLDMRDAPKTPMELAEEDEIEGVSKEVFDARRNEWQTMLGMDKKEKSKKPQSEKTDE